MNETLEIALQKALEIATKTGDFIVEQSPLLLQEFYKWHITIHIFFLFVAIIILGSTFIFPIFWSKKEKDDYYECKHLNRYFTEDGEVSFKIVLILGIIISSILFMVHIYKLLFLIIAPKIYLIEYFIK